MAFLLTRRALWVVGALLLLPGAPAQAAPRASIEGFITAHQDILGTRRITIEDDDGRQVAVTVTRRTWVGMSPPPPPDGGGSYPTDLLRVGTFVSATYYRNSGVALSIGSSGDPSLRRVTGTLVGVNPLQIDQNGDGEADLTMETSSWYRRYFLGGYPASEAELPLLVGLPVEIFSTLGGGNHLHRLRATLPATTTLQTRIEEVDEEERRLTVRLGSSGLDLYALTGIDLTVRGVPVSLEVVRPGDLARLEFAVLPSGERVLVRAELLGLTLKRATGTITAVEVPPRRLTLATRRGPLIVGVARDATITFVQGPYENSGELADLEHWEGPDARVEVLYVERRTERLALTLRVTVPSILPPPPPN